SSPTRRSSDLPNLKPPHGKTTFSQAACCVTSSVSMSSGTPKAKFGSRARKSSSSTCGKPKGAADEKTRNHGGHSRHCRRGQSGNGPRYPRVRCDASGGLLAAIHPHERTARYGQKSARRSTAAF